MMTGDYAGQRIVCEADNVGVDNGGCDGVHRRAGSLVVREKERFIQPLLLSITVIMIGLSIVF